jgi:hypothetical protein
VGPIGSCWVLLGRGRSSWVLLDPSNRSKRAYRLHLDLPGSTGSFRIYQGSPGSTRIRQNASASIRTHQHPTEFTKIQDPLFSPCKSPYFFGLFSVLYPNLVFVHIFVIQHIMAEVVLQFFLVFHSSLEFLLNLKMKRKRKLQNK